MSDIGDAERERVRKASPKGFASKVEHVMDRLGVERLEGLSRASAAAIRRIDKVGSGTVHAIRGMLAGIGLGLAEDDSGGVVDRDERPLERWTADEVLAEYGHATIRMVRSHSDRMEARWEALRVEIMRRMVRP